MREFLQVLSVGLAAVAVILAIVALSVPTYTILKPGRRENDDQKALSGAETRDSEAKRDPRRREGGSRGARWRIQEPRDGW